MRKLIGDQLFTLGADTAPAAAFQRCSAAELHLKEVWFRDAIFKAPDLVIGPCRAAGLTDDEWYPWQREYRVAVGSIDVLLLSSEGRIALVETKLSSNPELRRSVLAQVLDYLTHLADSLDTSMPEIPKDENGAPVANVDDIRESVAQGDILVIIVSDDIDLRVARLSRGLISDHVTKQWDVVLMDLALYRPLSDSSATCMIVPHICNLVVSEPRQVVRVVVEGETPTARVLVERITGDEASPVRQRWDEKRFFENLDAENAPSQVRELAAKLHELAGEFPRSVRVAWGTGREGSMVVKRNGQGLIEIYGSGRIRFRPSKFRAALGDKVASEYRRALEQLVPESMRMGYPSVAPNEAAQAAPTLHDLIRRTVAEVERQS